MELEVSSCGSSSKLSEEDPKVAIRCVEVGLGPAWAHRLIFTLFVSMVASFLHNYQVLIFQPILSFIPSLCWDMVSTFF